MRNPTVPLLALSVLTLASAQLGVSLKDRNVNPCAPQDTCKFLGRWISGGEASAPKTNQSYQIVNRNMKVILTGMSENETVFSAEYVATRYPLTQQDRAFLLSVVNRAAKGKYSQDLIDRCFAKVDAQVENADHGNEEVLLATESVGVRCFKRRYTHWYASGIRVFWPMG